MYLLTDACQYPKMFPGTCKAIVFFFLPVNEESDDVRYLPSFPPVP